MSKTKTITGKGSGDITPTFTLTFTGPDNLDVSGSSFSLSSLFPTLTAKITQNPIGTPQGFVRANLIYSQNSNSYRNFKSSSNDSYINWSNNETKTISATSSNFATLTTSSFFNSNNPTERSVPVSYSLQNVLGSYSSAAGISDWRPGNSTITLGQTITLNAPPILDSTNNTSTEVTFDTEYVFAGLTKARVTVGNFSAQYGGSIVSATLRIGNQTESIDQEGVIEIDLASGGSFTPTVTFTDSRGQVSTRTLSPIIVDSYAPPTVSISDVERTTVAGIVNDEGTSAVITTAYSFTSVIANLQDPIVTVEGPSGVIPYACLAWYEDRALTTPINNWENVTSGSTVYALIRGYVLTADTTVQSGKDYYEFDGTDYVKVDDPAGNPYAQGWYEVDGIFNTQYSYQISVTPVDTESQGAVSTQMLGGAYYTVDFLAGGHGIAFGLPASEEGFVCGMEMYLALPEYQESGAPDNALYEAICKLGWDDEVLS